MLLIKKFVFSPFHENTYIIYDDVTKDAAVIDPGCYDEIEEKMLDDFIFSKSLRVQYLINTHCHIDHIFGNAFIKKKYNPIYLAPEKDVFMINLMIETAKSYDVELKKSPLPDKYIDETKILTIGESHGRFIFTPGHTPGEYCLYFQNEKICFTGDVLFKGSIGRTDLWGGDYNLLLNSIREKLFCLPGDVVIYPGHESQSTIEDEKKHNPFFN